MIFLTSLFFCALSCIQKNVNDEQPCSEAPTPSTPTSTNSTTGDSKGKQAEFHPNDSGRHAADEQWNQPVRNPYWEFMEMNRTVSREWRATEIPFFKSAMKDWKKYRNGERPEKSGQRHRRGFLSCIRPRDSCPEGACGN